MGHKSTLICYTTHFSMLLYHRRLPTTTRPDRAALAEKGKTEATPPFLPLVRQTGRGFGAGFVTGFGAYPAPPYGGRFRPIYPCGKARIKAHAQQRIRAGERPYEMVSSGWFWLLFQES